MIGIDRFLESYIFKHEFLRKYVWRRWMFFMCWRWENFGVTEFGGTQLFRLKIIPKRNVKCEYILNQHYDTHEIWSVGSYFACIDGRDS